MEKGVNEGIIMVVSEVEFAVVAVVVVVVVVVDMKGQLEWSRG